LFIDEPNFLNRSNLLKRVPTIFLNIGKLKCASKILKDQSKFKFQIVLEHIPTMNYNTVIV